MATEEDIFNFMKTRNISENVIQKLKEDKIDVSVIDVMTDEQLAQYIERYGDRLAIKAFCRQRNVSFERTAEVKCALMQRVRDKLQGQRMRKTPADGNTAGPKVGNKHAVKDSRRVEMGWLHYYKDDYHQVRTKHGGGTRHLTVSKSVTMGELLEIGKQLFFPNGHSSKGPVEDFAFDIRDFSHEIVPRECTVNQLYEQTKIRMLRIYTCSQEKDKEVSPAEVLSDSSSDFEPTEGRGTKARRLQRPLLRNRTRRSDQGTGPDQQLDHSDLLSNSDILPSASTLTELGIVGQTANQIGHQAPEMSCAESPHAPSLSDAGNSPHQAASSHDSEELYWTLTHNQDHFNTESNSPFTTGINASLEDSEVQFGPVPNHDGDGLDSTLLWNPDDLITHQHSTINDGSGSPSNHPASPGGHPASFNHSEKEIRFVTIRRINVVHDVIKAFMEPDVLDVVLKIKLKGEKAVDSDGVSREVYSAFWENFLEQCEGEEERVPRLRPDFTEMQWQAVGRVWLKGFLDHNIIPIRLSAAFVLASCQGVGSVDEELLMLSFRKFISAAEREAVEKALEGNMDEATEEDLLDLFSRMGSHCLPSKDNLWASLVTMAHKVLLQEPKFVIDCFHSSVHSAVPSLSSKDSIMQLYESKRATNKKVAQMIKPSSESLSPQEQSTLNHLLRYLRSIDQRKLEIFLRFCTGSTVLCKDTIEVTFNKLSGLSRRLVAHTCGAVLELPCTYSSYPEFRTELDNILSGDCFTMDIL